MTGEKMSKNKTSKSMDVKTSKTATVKTVAVKIAPAVLAWRTRTPIVSDANNAYGVRANSVIAKILESAARPAGLTFAQLEKMAVNDDGTQQSMSRVLGVIRAGKRDSGFRGYQWPVTETDTKISVGKPHAMTSAKKSRKTA